MPVGKTAPVCLQVCLSYPSTPEIVHWEALQWECCLPSPRGSVTQKHQYPSTPSFSAAVQQLSRKKNISCPLGWQSSSHCCQQQPKCLIVISSLFSLNLHFNSSLDFVGLWFFPFFLTVNFLILFPFKAYLRQWKWKNSNWGLWDATSNI